MLTWSALWLILVPELDSKLKVEIMTAYYALNMDGHVLPILHMTASKWVWHYEIES